MSVTSLCLQLRPWSGWWVLWVPVRTPTSRLSTAAPSLLCSKLVRPALLTPLHRPSWCLCPFSNTRTTTVWSLLITAHGLCFGAVPVGPRPHEICVFRLSSRTKACLVCWRHPAQWRGGGHNKAVGDEPQGLPGVRWCRPRPNDGETAQHSLRQTLDSLGCQLFGLFPAHQFLNAGNLVLDRWFFLFMFVLFASPASIVNG